MRSCDLFRETTKMSVRLAFIGLVLPLCSQAAEPNAWFYQSSNLLMQQELSTCYDYKAAGNAKFFNYCLSSKLNAFDYIKKKIDDRSINRMIGETVCVEQIGVKFELGARCMAAAVELCRQDDQGNIIDLTSCFRIMGNGNWLANPTALRLDFTKPNRKEEDIKQYIQ